MALVHVRFKCDRDAPVVISRLEPDVTSIFQTGANGNARLINSVTLNHAVAGLDAQRVFLCLAIGLLFVAVGKQTDRPNGTRVRSRRFDRPDSVPSCARDR